MARETVDGRAFVRVWFRTEGCAFDKQGLCTMCNYGAGDGVPPDIVDQVRAALAANPVAAAATVLISPSGSMFDRREVPADLRQALLSVVAQTPAAAVICETRSETVSAAAMRDFKAGLPGKTPVIEMGLESSDPWVLRWCVNKRLDPAEFADAVRVCDQAGVKTLANVALGSAFLSPAAALRDAITTAQWAVDAGVGGCVLFPLHVREWTLLGWLWRQGLYKPPSLWSLIEVLRAVKPRRPGQLSTAWYRDYHEGHPVEKAALPILASPTTCPACVDSVLALLDDFRDSGNVAAFDALLADPCACRQEWADGLGEPGVDLGHVAECYKAIADGLMPERWWDGHGEGLVADMLASASTSLAREQAAPRLRPL
ncbi:MAG: hypothetical protein LBH76_00330 [Propionibacteriaceae bacterium]|nr:hypothetical protein [Propionibacteriaceae bacterium]